MIQKIDKVLHKTQRNIVWLMLCPFDEIQRAQREFEIVSKKGYFIHIVDVKNGSSMNAKEEDRVSPTCLKKDWNTLWMAIRKSRKMKGLV